MPDQLFQLYEGMGVTLHDRGLSAPVFPGREHLFAPAGYQADSGLRDAVNVALALGQPLLVSGEPGVGKTQLAYSVAYELGLPLFSFSTKSTSSHLDLFYRYDALRHFQDAQLHSRVEDLSAYIDYGPLGRAILCASAGVTLPFRPPTGAEVPHRSVVLIDEVDKAPRDFPNDILNEIETMSFEVRETGITYRADSKFMPVVILTTNLERDLPEAFRRRCVFYHIPFPDENRITQIVMRRLSLTSSFDQSMLQAAVQEFMTVRSLPLDKPPAIAELLAWIEVLQRLEIDPIGEQTPEKRARLLATYSILGKSEEDLNRIRDSRS